VGKLAQFIREKSVRVVSTGNLDTKAHKERNNKKKGKCLLRDQEGNVKEIERIEKCLIDDYTSRKKQRTILFAPNPTTGFIAAKSFGWKSLPSSGSYKC